MKRTLTALSLALISLADLALAEIKVIDAYARSATPMAKAGAAFMVIENEGRFDDRLVSASSPAAARVELHTHKESDGIMQMIHVKEGFILPSGGSHKLERGGDHVMFMGLTERWEQGDMVLVTLRFEQAGDITLEIMVDRERKDTGTHGSMSQVEMDHGN